MSKRASIIRNERLEQLLAIERQARIVATTPWGDGQLTKQLVELARILGPRKE